MDSALSVEVRAISYEKQVVPLFKQYCLECHGPDEEENDVRIDTLDLDFKRSRSMIGICFLAAQPQRWGFFNESGASSTPTFSVEQAA